MKEIQAKNNVTDDEDEELCRQKNQRNKAEQKIPLITATYQEVEGRLSDTC